MSEFQVVELEAVTVAVLRETVAMADLRQYYDRAYGAVVEVIGAQGVEIAGPAVGVYFGVPTDVVDVAAGFPVTTTVQEQNGVTSTVLPSGRAAQTMHIGSYDGLGETYRRLNAWMLAEHLVPGSQMWESYLTMPTPESDPADMRTLITWTLASQ